MEPSVEFRRERGVFHQRHNGVGLVAVRVRLVNQSLPLVITVSILVTHSVIVMSMSPWLGTAELAYVIIMLTIYYISMSQNSGIYYHSEVPIRPHASESVRASPPQSARKRPVEINPLAVAPSCRYLRD